MNDRAMGKGIRRKRTWYRRRLRARRVLIALAFGTALAGASWLSVARHLSSLSLTSWHSSQASPNSFWTRQNVRTALSFAAARSAMSAKPTAPPPGVYPYSVIPGGIKDPDDLRYAALRDYVIRGHYSHFNYSQFRLLRATEAREVYLSYRIRDSVFWTRKKIRLHAGELLLTDGKITARARCGNQISDTAKPEVSKEEPAVDVLDRPVAQLEPGPSFPIRPLLAPTDLAAGLPLAPQLLTGPFVFPYVPVGEPLPTGTCPIRDQLPDGRCRSKPHSRPVIPEPSTMVLISSGLAIVLSRYRKFARPESE